MIVPDNCLSHTLDKLHEEGGYLAARCSDHWGRLGVSHVVHFGANGVSNRQPENELDTPLQALVGFDGVTNEFDVSDATPQSKFGIWLSAMFLAIGVTFWFFDRAFLTPIVKLIFKSKTHQ